MFGNVTRRMFYCWRAFGAGDAQGVGRAYYPSSAGPIEDVGVDHCRLDVLVAEELLDSANVVASQEQMGGE